jgi:hypothetical protein
MVVLLVLAACGWVALLLLALGLCAAASGGEAVTVAEPRRSPPARRAQRSRSVVGSR